MSDEEDSMSEGFSASEDEWKPSKDIKGGESSDDDDSDFEESPLAGAASGGSGVSAGRKRGESKPRSATKQISKKRTGLSLRTKLYNKYRPPPKTFSPPGSVVGQNSPTASTSHKNSKNDIAPNESKSIRRKAKDGDDSDSGSDSSIDNYLVNPEDLDLQSSFFNVEAKRSVSPAPIFDCNAGLKNLSDSATDNEEDGGKAAEKAFDFQNLLEYAKTLDRVKESVAIHNAEESKKKPSAKGNIDALDVYAVLALGEKQQNRSHNDGEDEDDEDEVSEQQSGKKQPLKLSKTKSTRVKRHTKTRPTSTVAANDTDDSDWEEVADSTQCIDNKATSSDISHIGNLEIHVELPSRKCEKKTKSQQDIEMAFKRKINRDIKERQILLHKTSLLCHFGRLFLYNRLLNDTILMQKVLKLLPSKSAYPPNRGTEIKYYQSMVTWYKSVIKLKTQNLYPEKSAAKTKSKAHVEILKQIEKKEARSKQDMIFILIILLRGMGLQCRLVANMQPLPLKPPQSNLLTIKMKKHDDNSGSERAKSIRISDNKSDGDLKGSPPKAKVAKKETHDKKKKNEADQQSSKNQQKSSNKSDNCVDNSTKATKQNECVEEPEMASCHKAKAANDIENKKSRNKVKPNISVLKTKTKNTTKKPNEKPQNEEARPLNSSQRSVSPSNQEEKPNGNYERASEATSKSDKNNADKAEIREAKTTGKSKSATRNFDNGENNLSEELESSQKENKTKNITKSSLARLKRAKPKDNTNSHEDIPNKKPVTESCLGVVPKVVVHTAKDENVKLQPGSSRVRNTRSRSKSPQVHISTAFLVKSQQYEDKFPEILQKDSNAKNKTARNKSSMNKAKISPDFLKNTQNVNNTNRVLRSRQKTNEVQLDDQKAMHAQIPQLDGANDDDLVENAKVSKPKRIQKQRPNLKKIKANATNSDEDFEPSPPKKPKTAPALAKKSRRVVSSDDENDNLDSTENTKRKETAGDLWLEVWCDVEEQWVCVDIFKGKIHCVDTIRKSASPSLAYIFAFQNDLTIKDVTARYCPNWTTVVRKSRVDKAWLDAAISKYLNHRTKRDMKEDEELRRIHEEKPMPTTISEYKNHPFYALERHLLKFEAIYPPNAPALGYVRGEPVFSRDCVHTLHSREIWLKQARTVKLGEKPYKIVKARPKWDRITQTVIKDQPLEIFGYWQTQDYEPPTAENGLVPRNAYGNVELFKPSMLPKKTKHIRLPGLNRICKKLGIDCANAVVGFDFHQGACHPTYDGFVVCEEFEDQVVAAWHQDQEEQERKEQEKYEARVYGNWKKLIRGLLIRERLKLKYNF